MTREDAAVDFVELQDCVGKNAFQKFVVNHKEDYDPDVLQVPIFCQLNLVYSVIFCLLFFACNDTWARQK